MHLHWKHTFVSECYVTNHTCIPQTTKCHKSGRDVYFAKGTSSISLWSTSYIHAHDNVIGDCYTSMHESHYVHVLSCWGQCLPPVVSPPSASPYEWQRLEAIAACINIWKAVWKQTILDFEDSSHISLVVYNRHLNLDYQISLIIHSQAYWQPASVFFISAV